MPMSTSSGSPSLLPGLGLALALVSAASGCRPDTSATSDREQLVGMFGGEPGQACEYVSSQTQPYVVAWDEMELNDLQRAIGQGPPVVVRVAGCELELLLGCTPSGGRYQFSRARMTKPRTTDVRTAAEAVAELQIGGLGFETYFDSFERLSVTRALGGTWEVVDRDDFYQDEFSSSRCQGATHVVHAIDVGAYRVQGTQAKAGGAKVQGGVAGAKAGVGGGGSSSHDDLTHKGDPERCGTAGWGDAPVDECSTPLRLTLRGIRPAAERDSVCPYGMQHVVGGKLGDFSLLEFCIDATEVTAAAYAECVDAGACDAPARSRYGTWREAGKERHPVTDVTWYDATRYCEHAGKRLPTAEEWEWAARGRDEERPLPWGTMSPTSDLACWNRADAGLGTCPTGEHPLGQSRDGVLDLAGNVAEWTASPFEGNERRRVVMGGSWRDELGPRLQASTRSGHKARDQGNGDLGFRCAAAVRPLELGRGRAI